MSSSPTTRKTDHDHDPTPYGITSLAMSLLAAPLRPLRPLLPHMFPLIVCLLCIPVLMFFSGAAGWVVWSNVPVGWKADVYLQYGDAINPFAITYLPPILSDQPYDVSLHLVLPATESNFALGNFMATLHLTTAYNESISTIRRSTALVPLHSSLLKQALLGSPSTTKVDIPLLFEFVAGTSAVHARLELGRSDGWKGIGNGQGRELSVLEATLKGTVRPKGMRAILARYPRITTFISTFTFFFISLMIVSAFLFTAIRPGSSSSHPPSPTGSRDSGSEDGHDSDGPHPQRFSRRHSLKRDSESDTSARGDEKGRDPDFGSGLRLTGLRKRRSSTALDGLDASKRPSQIKIEVDDMSSRRSATPPLYPKSPFPRPESTAASSGSSRRQSVTPILVSPSEADVES